MTHDPQIVELLCAGGALVGLLLALALSRRFGRSRFQTSLAGNYITILMFLVSFFGAGIATTVAGKVAGCAGLFFFLCLGIRRPTQGNSTEDERS